MNYKCKPCEACYSKIYLNEHEKFTDTLFLMEVENDRRIYFSPVGNQFNFGYYNNGYTPKVAIIGITTSYSAYKNFSGNLKEFIDEGDNFNIAFRKACTLNIFNSEPYRALRGNLNKILKLAQVNKIIGTKKIELEQDALKKYINGKADEDTEKMLDEVYFSQAIPCASCTIENKITAPKPKEIGSFQNSCIKTQIDFICSFNKPIELMIVFGKKFDFVNRWNGDNMLRNKYRRSITIDHPSSGRGWNALELMSLPKEGFYKEIEKKYTCDKYKGTRISCFECYDQIQKLKDYVNDILAQSEK